MGEAHGEGVARVEGERVTVKLREVVGEREALGESVGETDSVGLWVKLGDPE